MSELPVLEILRKEAQKIDATVGQLEHIFSHFFASDQGRGIRSGNETSAIFEQSDFTNRYYLSLERGKDETVGATISLAGTVRLQSTSRFGTADKTFSIAELQQDEAAATFLQAFIEFDDEASITIKFQTFLHAAMGYSKPDHQVRQSLNDTFDHEM